MDKTVIDEIKEGLYDAWQEVKSLVKEIVKIITSCVKKAEHKYNWHIPKSITRGHQVIDRQPLDINIRKDL